MIMAKEGIETSFYSDGERVSFYLQKGIEKRLENAISDYPYLFKSKSHFICCAINRELRRLEKFKPECEFNE